MVLRSDDYGIGYESSITIDVHTKVDLDPVTFFEDILGMFRRNGREVTETIVDLKERKKRKKKRKEKKRKSSTRKREKKQGLTGNTARKGNAFVDGLAIYFVSVHILNTFLNQTVTKLAKIE